MKALTAIENILKETLPDTIKKQRVSLKFCFYVKGRLYALSCIYKIL